MDLQASLTPQEVSELLKITKNTVYELIKRGELPSYKIGKKIRIDMHDVEAYINNQKNSLKITDSKNISSTSRRNAHNSPFSGIDQGAHDHRGDQRQKCLRPGS